MNKNNNYEKEIGELYSLLSKESSTPDLNFKSALKAKYIQKLNDKQSNYLLGFLGANYFKLIIASMLLVIVFSSLGIYEVINFNRKTNISKDQYTAQDKKNIIENIIKNNTFPLLGTTSAEVLSGNIDNINSTNVGTTIQPNLNDYNYRYTEINIEKNQNSLADCDLSELFPENYKFIKIYEYFNNTTTYYKYIFEDAQGNLQNYLLGKTDESSIEITQYNGGDVAKKLIILRQKDKTLPVSYPVSFPMSFAIENNIDHLKSYTELFSKDNVTISKSQNDPDMIILERSEQLECKLFLPLSYPLSYPNNEDKKKMINILYKDYVNQSDYTINRSELFIGNSDKENLYLTISSKSKKELKTLDSVKDLFAFDYNVKIDTLTK